MSLRIQVSLLSLVASALVAGSLCTTNQASAQQSTPGVTLVRPDSEQAFLSNAEKRYALARTAYNDLSAQYSLLFQKLAIARARYQAGQSTVDETLTIQAQVQDLEQQLKQKNQEMNAEAVVAALMRRISVDFTQADLRVCAGLIAKHSALDMQVAPEVATDIRLTITAREITVAALLEAIADEAHLMIVPAGQGILLTNWPSLTVNGQTTPSKEGNQPWSEDWGPSTGSPYRGLQWKSLFNRPVAMDTALELADSFPFHNPGNFPFGGSSTVTKAAPAVRSSSVSAVPERSLSGVSSTPMPPITMTPMGENRVVIAEPYSASEGKQRILLTVYSWDGTHLNRMSSTVHTLGMTTVPPVKVTAKKP